MLLALRADVSTMRAIVKQHRLWVQGHPNGSIDEFANDFLAIRYGLPGFHKADSEVMLRVARLALPFYSRTVNADGSVSYLALLGAVAEAERFLVDPEVVLRKTERLCRGLPNRMVGSAGVPYPRGAFALAERSFREYTSALERQRMGLADVPESVETETQTIGFGRTRRRSSNKGDSA